MRSRAWGLVGGCALTLLVVVALVAWRAPAASPGWRTALAITGVLAVVALLVSASVAGAQALSAERPREVSVSVPRGGGAPAAAVTDAAGPRWWTLLALVIALAGTAPVLVVLVLASTVDVAHATTPADPPAASAPTTSAPTKTGPTPDQPGTTDPAQPSPPQPSLERPRSTKPPSTQPPSSPSGPSSSPDAPGTSGTSPPDPGEPGAVEPSEAPPAAGCTAVVSSGDTLWGLALSRLVTAGVEPDDDLLAAETARLYAANTGVVGPDPDLLRPGQRLDLCS